MYIVIYSVDDSGQDHYLRSLASILYICGLSNKKLAMLCKNPRNT